MFSVPWSFLSSFSGLLRSNSNSFSLLCKKKNGNTVRSLMSFMFFSPKSTVMPEIHLIKNENPVTFWDVKSIRRNIFQRLLDYMIRIRLLFYCRKIMAVKFHLCLLLIILGTIAVQGARPGKPYFLPRQVGSKCLLLGLYIFRKYALIVTAHLRRLHRVIIYGVARASVMF